MIEVHVGVIFEAKVDDGDGPSIHSSHCISPFFVTVCAPAAQAIQGLGG